MQDEQRPPEEQPPTPDDQPAETEQVPATEQSTAADQPAAPEAPPPMPAAGETVADARERSGRRRAILVGLAAAIVVGAAAFFAGRETVDVQAAEERGFDRGQAEATRELRPGNPRYKLIYDRGYKAGRAAGLREGSQAGAGRGAENGRQVSLVTGGEQEPLQGDEESIQAGAEAALGGFTDWDTGVFYVVTVTSGQGGVPFRIEGRRKLETSQRYAVCERSETSLCREPIPQR